jgi:hypothetical protein
MDAIQANTAQKRVPERGETKRVRRRGEEPYSRTATTHSLVGRRRTRAGIAPFWDAFYLTMKEQ